MRGDWDVSIRRPGQAHLEQRIRDICQTPVRYGYRRVHVLLRREGYRHGQNKTRLDITDAKGKNQRGIRADKVSYWHFH
jgi:hypothetical protein